jgi:hypothetical protein
MTGEDGEIAFEPQLLSRHGGPCARIVGNLGALAIQDVARGAAPRRDPLLDHLAALARDGFDAVEDYVGWSVIEPRGGHVDPAVHREHRDAATRAGLDYVAFAWMHALPADVEAAGYDPFVCAEHGEATCHPSIFAPRTAEFVERYFDALHEVLSPDLQALTLALPCDYGEFGYPTGMGSWVFDRENPATHRHAGLWCADPFAKAALRARLLARCGSVRAAAAICGAAWRDESDIAPPADFGALSPRGRIEIVAFLRDSLLDFVATLVSAAQRRFPRARLGIKCGYGGELAAYGIDYAALAAFCRASKITLWSTHGTFPTAFHKRLATLCRRHRVPYFTEGLTERERIQVLDRLFEDAGDGARGFFEFHATYESFASDVRARWSNLRASLPRLDLAVLFRSTQLVLEPSVAFPPGVLAIDEPLRDAIDYELVDEPTLIASPLAAATLIVPDPGEVGAPALAAIREYAARGGVVVLPSSPSLCAIGEREACVAGLDAPRFAAPLGREEARFVTDVDAGREIRFGDGDEHLLFGAWLGIERAEPYFGAQSHARARWISGRAGIRVPAPAGARLVRVDLHVPPLAIAARPIDVLVDGDRRAALATSGNAQVELPLAPSASPRVVEIGFDGEPFAPADRGGSDSRRLLLLLHRLIVSIEAGDAPARVATFEVSATATDAALASRFVRHGRGGFLVAPAGDAQALIALALASLARRSLLVRGAADVEIAALAFRGARLARVDDSVLVYHRADRRRRGELSLGGGPIALTLEPRESRLIGGPPDAS